MSNEKESAAHIEFRSHAGNKNRFDGVEDCYGIEHPSSTGMIYVTNRAQKIGYRTGDHTWANLGEGAPEVGHIEGCMDKPTHIDTPLESLEYANTDGLPTLKEKVAALYNDLHRQDKTSKYTADNVAIVPGGRAGFIRVASTIADVQVGYFLPEYTPYEQMLSIFKRFVPIPAVLEEETSYHIDPNILKKEISNRGLSLVVTSNPRNPTGQVIDGEDLKELVKVGRERHTTLVLDEFYSAYVYSESEEQTGRVVSAAKYVEDVDKDPVIIIDGLTKNWRLPGFRVCWIVAPKSVISAVKNSGSFLDGGANHPLQLAALPFVEPDIFRKEAKALQTHFKKKRDAVLDRLKEIGFDVKVKPNSTFYIWLDLKGLPAPINAGLIFFEECLKEKTMIIPGIFFDINPSHRRELYDSQMHHFVRLSFGPPLEEVLRGLDAIERVVKKFKK